MKQRFAGSGLFATAAFFVTLSACSSSGTNAVIPASGYGPVNTLAKERVKIRQFADLPIYSDYYGPSAIASGPEQSLWVTDTIDQDFGENAVVQIATSGQAVNTFYYGGRTSEGSDLLDITAGPDGNLWMTDGYNEQILKMTTGGTFTGYPLTNYPESITTGPDKALWFTEGGGSTEAIGRITTGGTITRYDASGGVYGIAVGSDKALWYTEETASAIGRITTKGKITVFSKGITAGSDPNQIAAGPDGALWFTEYKGGRIGRITTSGKVTEFSRGITSGEYPYGIAAGPDGAMWFTESQGNNSGFSTNAKIGRITMSGKITEYSKNLTSTSDPTSIVQGPDKKMWFVESYSDMTGRLSI